ncbi:TPA: LOW QUALITY PROTEIN: hypothetical protein N0F65_001454, partial [Lagenidium giganteum]
MQTRQIAGWTYPKRFVSSPFEIFAGISTFSTFATSSPTIGGYVTDWIWAWFIHDTIDNMDLFLASVPLSSSVNACAVMLDIQKAYDTVYRPFLLKTLKWIGFPTGFVTAVDRMHRHTSAQFKMIQPDVHRAPQLLEKFRSASGLYLNASKTMVLPLHAGTEPSASEFTTVDHDEIIRHLGVQLSFWRRLDTSIQTKLALALGKTRDPLQRIRLVPHIAMPRILYVARHVGPGRRQLRRTQKMTEKRFTWTLSTMEALVTMRFEDEQVACRIGAADTHTKKRLAWQYFAGRLSERLGITFTADQVQRKYKCKKCDYRKGKRASTQTGNIDREDESKLWGILTRAFAWHTGIATTSLGDGDDGASDGEEISFKSPVARARKSPVSVFASAMKEGMTVIASSMGSDQSVAAVPQDIKQHKQTALQIQERQLRILEK